jgi:hypothetical protein
MNQQIQARILAVGSRYAVLVPGTVAAAVVQYSNRTDWRVAAGGGTGDIADDFNAGSLTRSAFTLTDDTSGSIAFFPNENSTNAIDGTGYLRLLPNAPTDFATFTFSSPISARGRGVFVCGERHGGGDLQPAGHGHHGVPRICLSYAVYHLHADHGRQRFAPWNRQRRSLHERARTGCGHNGRGRGLAGCGRVVSSVGDWPPGRLKWRGLVVGARFRRASLMPGPG